MEKSFAPARKAHPAFGVADLDEMREALLAHGIAVTDDEELPGQRGFYAEDPWGNRLEFVAPR